MNSNLMSCTWMTPAWGAYLTTAAVLVVVVVLALRGIGAFAGWAWNRVRDPQQSVRFRDLETPLRHALVRLVGAPLDERRFLICEDRLTEQFVQFATTPKGLLIDIPMDQLGTEVWRVKAILGGECRTVNEVVFALQKEVTVAEGVALAMTILKDVYGVYGDAYVVLSEGGS